MISLSKLLTVAFILLGFTAYAEAQSNNVTLGARTAQGTIAASPGTGSITLGGTQASGISLNGSYGSATFTVTGGWSGTIIPEGQSCDVAGTWNTIQVFPFTSSAGQSSITANGLYIGAIAGLCGVRLRGNTVATATASGTITAASVGGAGAGGGGGGNISNFALETGGNLATVVTNTAAAIPTGGNVIGYTTVDPCTTAAKTNVAISFTTTGSTQLIGLSGTTKIYVCSLAVISSTATVFAITGGTGTNCGTPAALIGTTAAANSLALAANGGLTLGNGAGTIAVTAAGSELCIVQTGAGYIGGNLTYVQQ